MMLDVLGADFIRTAMAKGLSRRRALIRHALRTALIPVVTYFAFTFGALLTGATFTEKIFGWHGLGEQLINSIFTNDVNTVAAITCLAAVAVLLRLVRRRRCCTPLPRSPGLDAGCGAPDDAVGGGARRGAHRTPARLGPPRRPGSGW